MKKILLFNLDRREGMNLEAHLAMAGHDVVMAETADELTAGAAVEGPDLVIADASRVDAETAGAIAQLRATPAGAGVPWLFLAYPGEEMAVGGLLSADTDAVLRQPVLPAELNLAVRSKLRQADPAWLPPVPAAAATPEMFGPLHLTEQEAIVLCGLVRGETDAQMAKVLEVNVDEVEGIFMGITFSLGVADRAGPSPSRGPGWVEADQVRLMWVGLYA